jgi:uncharacterized protein (DUF433 family)
MKKGLKMAIEMVLNGHIEVMPAVRGGKPHLAGTRITVDDVVLMHYRLGQSLEEIAGKYDLSLAAVFAAMAYYYDHRDEVDRRIQEDQAFVEAFRRANPSPLQEKLRALGRV